MSSKERLGRVVRLIAGLMLLAFLASNYSYAQHGFRNTFWGPTLAIIAAVLLQTYKLVRNKNVYDEMLAALNEDMRRLGKPPIRPDPVDRENWF